MKKGIVFTIILSFIAITAFSEGFIMIDIKPYANSKIMKTNWWTGQPGNTDLEEALEIVKNGHNLSYQMEARFLLKLRMPF